MLFPHEISFEPAEPERALALLPARPAVFALRGEAGEPYLNRAADLRRRLRKLLTPAPAQTRRLQLAGMVRRIAWAETASEFDGQMLLYRATAEAFGERASQRMHLRAPSFLRMGMRNRFPRVWITNTLSLSTANDLFGPMPSRHAAERYAEAVLDLHLLRHCFQDLDPDPEFPGCIYSEMKKCLAPCYGGCSDERYREEAAAVHAFLRTSGVSLLGALGAERDRASEALDFEGAAAVHTRYSKAEAAAALAPEIAGPLGDQHGAIVQPSVEPDQVELYLLAGGVLTGPESFSVLGMRLPNEQSGSSSLFAHPAVIAAVPLPAKPGEAAGEVAAVSPATMSSVTPSSIPSSTQSLTPEERLRAALAALQEQRQPATRQLVCDHQALLARWYFRPQAKREGELVLAERGGAIPLKALLRACARVYRAGVERHAPAMS